jgi:predicted Zn-dependent protease
MESQAMQAMNSRLRVLLLAALLLPLAACTTSPYQPETYEITPDGSEGRIRHELQDEDVAKLWQQAEELRLAGEFERAGEVLEKAIVIVPDDAVLWSRVAEMQLRTGHFVQAENYAAKSNSLMPGNRHLQYRNWLIIWHSRVERKDPLGAAEAQTEVDKRKP